VNNIGNNIIIQYKIQNNIYVKIVNNIVLNNYKDLMTIDNSVIIIDSLIFFYNI